MFFIKYCFFVLSWDGELVFEYDKVLAIYVVLDKGYKVGLLFFIFYLIFILVIDVLFN